MKLKLRLKFLIPLVLVTCCSTYLGAQDEPGNVTNTYALENVTVITKPGSIIPNATVIVKDGLIKSVSRNAIIPSNARMVKADSMYVYAGFIDGLSHIGVPKPKDQDTPKAKDPGNPGNERAGVTPERSVSDYLSPTDKSIADYRKAGFTAAHAVPRGKMLPGTGAVILLDGKKSTDLVFKDNASTFAKLKGAGGVFPNTVIAVMTKWRELYRQSQQASTHITKYRSSSSGMKRPSYDDATEAMIPVTKRQSRVFMYVEDHLSIHRAMKLQKDLGFQMALVGMQNGWRHADKIRAKNIPVLLSLELPKEDKKDKKDEITDEERKTLVERQKKEISERVGQASTFHKKGIAFGFTTEGVSAKDVKSSLTRMVKGGLSEQAALAAMTTNPATILGVQREMGTVEAGKIANLVVTNKPYFDEKSAIRYVFVDGNLHEYEAKSASAKKKGSGEVSEANEPAVGTWDYKIDAGEMELSGTLEIEESDGALVGTMSGQEIDTPVDISEIEFDGTAISFDVTVDDTDVTLKGTLADDRMEGTLSIAGQGTFPITADRTSTPD